MKGPTKNLLSEARHLVEHQFADLHHSSARLTEALAAQHEALRLLEQRWSQGEGDLGAALERALQSNALAGKRSLSLGRNLPRLRTRLHDLFQVQESEQSRHRQIETLYTVIAAANSTLDLDEVLSLVMNAIVRVTGAERAVLMLRDSAGHLTLRASHNLKPELLETPAFQISQGIVNRVASDGEPIITTNAQEDPRFRRRESVISHSLRSIICVPLRLREEVRGVIYADNRVRAGLFSTQDRDLLMALADQSAVAIENARLFAETRQRLQEMNAVYDVSQSITRTLDLEQVLQKITEEVLLAIPAAEKAVLHLVDESGEHLEPKAAAPASPQAVPASWLRVDQGLAGVALREQRPLRTPDAQADPRFIRRSADIGSLLVAPLVVAGRSIGTLTVDSKQKDAFAPGHERFLGSVAGQAAIAIENARLFANLRNKIDEIATIKNYMDNVFSSIASGVISIDLADRITTFNRAAEDILRIRQEHVLQKAWPDALGFLFDEALKERVEQVKAGTRTHLSYEMARNLPQRGDVDLHFRLSPLRDSTQNRTGVAIVVDDLTRQRALEQERERIRQMFQLYVAPSVVERLLMDSSQLQLGGRRREVTVLFADIRGFSTFSHSMSPEQLVDTLNIYLGFAADAILAEEGTLDKFMGDAVMAIFNAPLPQRNHAMLAVRAAHRFQRAITAYHKTISPGQRLSFGVGIATGEAVVGNVGTKQVRNYTAIGESVNLARRLQEGAAASKILLDENAFRQVQDFVEAREIPALQIKGWEEPVTVYELLHLVERKPSPV